LARLLWADDDGESRFSREISMLLKGGWEVHWSLCIEDAAKKLHEEQWDCVIIDQSLPFRPKTMADTRESPGVWGGCVLLWWLRRGEVPKKMPGAPSVAQERFFRTLCPHSSNRDLPVVVVSAFYDEHVLAVMRDCSPQDANLEVIPKPVPEYDFRDIFLPE
jgi:CheY-like chemotaxis protein